MNTLMNEWMNAWWLTEWMNEWMNEWMTKWNKCTIEWINNESINHWMNGRIKNTPLHEENIIFGVKLNEIYLMHLVIVMVMGCHIRYCFVII